MKKQKKWNYSVFFAGYLFDLFLFLLLLLFFGELTIYTYFQF